MPNRNSLVVLGDFNCTLPCIPRLVGQAHFQTLSGKRHGPQHGDMTTFSCLLQDFQLVALNTWTPSHGATSYAPSGSSRIDFLLTRHREADNQAKQVGLLDDFPLTTSGAYHVPMLTSLNYRYYKAARSHTSKFSRQVKHHCIEEYRHESLIWQQCENGINIALEIKYHFNISVNFMPFLHKAQCITSTSSAILNSPNNLDWQ